MLAVFCLRLALGMLIALAFLSPRLMHPRFFRTHFLTVLGLGTVAFVMSWMTDFEVESLSKHGFDPAYVTLLRVVEGVAVIASLLGAIVWMFERPLAGWMLPGICMIVQIIALACLGMHQVALRERALHPDASSTVTPLDAAPLVAGDLVSAALLGFAVTAMLVGHSYLISPGLTIRPLMGQIAGLGVALLARIAVAGAALWFWAGEHDITNLNDINVLWL